MLGQSRTQAKYEVRLFSTVGMSETFAIGNAGPQLERITMLNLLLMA